MKASKYRKRPVIVEAMQFTGENIVEVLAWASERSSPHSCPIKQAYDPFESKQLYIITPEGVLNISVGDFVICGVRGEFYPCKECVFNETYEPVD